MASSFFLASNILSLILFHFLLSTQPGHSTRILNHTPQPGFRVTLTRSAPAKKPIPNRHLDPLHNIEHGFGTTPLKPLKDEYVMNLAIGTPPKQFSAIMDTGSDLIWTDECKPGPSSNYSSSFSTIRDTDCDTYGLYGCKQTYGDGSSVTFALAHETFTIGEMKFPDIIFGCQIPDKSRSDDHGVVGLGRGKLSLVSQLDEQVFGYCMGSRFDNSKSVLLTGSKASSAIAKGPIQTMPLLKNDAKGYESLYYIPLEGISVGQTRLLVTKSDFAISNGGGGTIIDSGAAFTYLDERIIDMIEHEFVNQTRVKKITGRPRYNELKHCFKSPIDPKIVPEMVFHFEGADWVLSRENYIYDDRKSGLACLGFIGKDDQSSFGNLQQQNMLVVYDVDKNSLSFRHANCNEL